MEKDHPYRAEYAKSNRSSCRSCQEKISMNTLRLAQMIQSPRFDGKIPQWYHFRCFFSKSKVNFLEDIKGINDLRWEDQEKIKDKLSLSTSSAVVDHKVENSKTSRTKCAKCDGFILQNFLKFSAKDTDKNNTKKLKLGWYHVHCFVEMKDRFNTPEFDFTSFGGFKALDEDEQNELHDAFKDWKSRKRDGVKLEENGETESKKTKPNTIEELMKEQSDKLWRLKDAVSAQVPKTVMETLLTSNNQTVPIGPDSVACSLADALLFGSLPACPGGCNSNRALIFHDGRYECNAPVSEWAKCTYESAEVERREFVVPDEYRDFADCLRSYQYRAQTRILPSQLPDANNNSLGLRPLDGYRVSVDSGTGQMVLLQKTIREFGGNVANKIDCDTLALISTAEAVTGTAGQQGRVLIAKEQGVDIVSPDCLAGLSSCASVAEAVKKFAIWNSPRTVEDLKLLRDPSCATSKRNSLTVIRALERIKNSQTSKGRRKSLIISDDEDMCTLRIKGGAVVEPESGLANKAHLLQEPVSGDPLTAVLGLVDVARGNNSFYKLQLLEADKGDKFWLYRAWGRIGTRIGGNMKTKFSEKEEAVEKFEFYYKDKTANEWKNRNSFVKRPNKFYPMDIDYGEDEQKIIINESDTSSKLPQTVQDLIRFIFDIASMKQTIKEFEIDMNKMPLGKLSRNQIDRAYQVLKDLQAVLQPQFKRSVSAAEFSSRLQAANNQFYTLMPHNFGMRSPPLIDSVSMISTKCDMLDSLQEIEVAYRLMQSGGAQNAVGANIDSCYGQLGSRIQPLKRSTLAYQRICQYVANTQGATHRLGLTVQEIFEVERSGEQERFQHKFGDLHNRMMLWHGSRRTNWAGILSQGLRIAPPEAPVSGFMFGKGIYFADIVTKSANYCHATASHSEAVLLLCEVALGDMAERLEADSNIDVAQTGCHSCKGCGRFLPDPNDDELDEDGVRYPLGQPIKCTKHRGILDYNEYIVYNVAQVRQRYLVKVKLELGR